MSNESFLLLLANIYLAQALGKGIASFFIGTICLAIGTLFMLKVF